jgi:hypothetical protein
VSKGVGSVLWLSASDEGHDYVGGVAGRDLDVAKGHSCVEGGHDEGCSQHVRVDLAQPAPLADGADPAMRGAPVEALPFAATESMGPSQRSPTARSIVGLCDTSSAPALEEVSRLRYRDALVERSGMAVL